jgi:diguanylate cyclase (GGDEF)-like protein
MEVLSFLGRRLFIIGVSIGFAFALNPQVIEVPTLIVVALSVTVAFLETFARSFWRRQTPLQRLVSWTPFTVYSGYLAYLIAHTGGAQSPLILGYPILLINVVAGVSSLRAVLVAGVLGFIAHFCGVYFGEGGPGFLRASLFWVESVLMAGIFVNICWVTRVIAEKNLKLQRSRNALEKFAAGLKTSNEKLERLSYTDGVTGLYNYRYFQVRLQEEISRAKRYGRSAALIMADLDGFKKYNDTYGHPQGDVLLQRVAVILGDNVREEDAVIRYGGDEFAMILSGADAATALRIANRVRESIETMVNDPASRAAGVITVSCGIAVFPEKV